MLDLLAGFVAELRNAGLPVSLTENLDAMEAVQHIPIEDREAFKYALGATLVKNNAHWRAFETVFEVYFCLRGPRVQHRRRRRRRRSTRCGARCRSRCRQGEGSRAAAAAMESLTPEELAELLTQALMNGDQAMMRALARQAVQRFAGMEPGRPVGGTYYLYRTLRNLDLDGDAREADGGRPREQVGGELTPLEERLERDEYEIRIEQLQEGDRGRDPPPAGRRPRRRGDGQDAAQAAARRRRLHARHAATRWQTLRKALYPLTRKLAARLARKRRHGRKGPLDFRNTVRHSLSLRRRAGRAEVQVPAPGQAGV